MSKPHAPRKSNKKSASAEKNPDQEHHTAQASSLVVAYPKQPEKTYKEKPKPEPRGRDPLWLSILKILGLLAGIGYTVITYLQWRDLRRNFEVDQRAWLKVDFADFYGRTAPSSPFKVKLKNVGKSPALRIEADAVVEVVPRTQEWGSGWKSTSSTFGTMLFPSDDVDLPATLFTISNNAPRDLTDSERASLIDGQAYMVVYGMIQYVDQFGPHWTKFCTWKAFTDGAYPTRSCVARNAVGDGVP